jgi:hypothetical protein
VINTLKTTIDQYDRTGSREGQQVETNAADTDHPMTDNDAEQQLEVVDQNLLAARIMSLKGDVLRTLRDVIDTVSKYAGGALPENARVLVRRHLTSLPQRFRVANMMDNNAIQQRGETSEQGEQREKEARAKETRESAQRVLVLAKEGLDMMAQVSGVLDGTIVSAEEWCERLGKKRREEREPVLPQTEAPADEKNDEMIQEDERGIGQSS